MLDVLCKLLGIREDQAEDALRSERAAREALTRRSFFGVAGALAAGSAFSFAAPVDPAAAYEVRLISYPMLACSRPNAIVTFDGILRELDSVDRVNQHEYGTNAPLLNMLERPA